MSITETIGLALRLFQRRDQIVNVFKKSETLFNEVHELLGFIMPGSSTMDRMTPVVDSKVATPDGKVHQFDVPWLQQSLNLLMKGPPIRVDGNMGPATVDAIKTFQKSRGLVPDGWAGILTMGMIDDEMKTGKRK